MDPSLVTTNHTFNPYDSGVLEHLAGSGENFLKALFSKLINPRHIIFVFGITYLVTSEI
jgi:hypothetical protein